MDRTADIFAAAAAVFGIEREPLARLAELRQQSGPSGDLDALYRGAYLSALTRKRLRSAKGYRLRVNEVKEKDEPPTRSDR